MFPFEWFTKTVGEQKRFFYQTRYRRQNLIGFYQDSIVCLNAERTRVTNFAKLHYGLYNMITAQNEWERERLWMTLGLPVVHWCPRFPSTSYKNNDARQQFKMKLGDDFLFAVECLFAGLQILSCLSCLSKAGNLNYSMTPKSLRTDAYKVNSWRFYWRTQWRLWLELATPIRP